MPLIHFSHHLNGYSAFILLGLRVRELFGYQSQGLNGTWLHTDLHFIKPYKYMISFTVRPAEIQAQRETGRWNPKPQVLIRKSSSWTHCYPYLLSDFSSVSTDVAKRIHSQGWTAHEDVSLLRNTKQRTYKAKCNQTEVTDRWKETFKEILTKSHEEPLGAWDVFSLMS